MPCALCVRVRAEDGPAGNRGPSVKATCARSPGHGKEPWRISGCRNALHDSRQSSGDHSASTSSSKRGSFDMEKE